MLRFSVSLWQTTLASVWLKEAMTTMQYGFVSSEESKSVQLPRSNRKPLHRVPMNSLWHWQNMHGMEPLEFSAQWKWSHLALENVFFHVSLILQRMKHSFPFFKLHILDSFMSIWNYLNTLPPTAKCLMRESRRHWLSQFWQHWFLFLFLLPSGLRWKEKNM